MILEFQVENFLSFKDKASLSMLSSSSLKRSPNFFIELGKYNILSTVAIYGANASGKSNFLKALSYMKEFIFNSARESQIGQRIKLKNFRLNTESEKKPSTFEMTFIVKKVQYKKEIKDVVFRYGFQVSHQKVHAEWLFGRFTTQESKLFTRIDDDITIGEKFVEGKQVYKTLGKIRETSLFLSQIASIKGENASITHEITRWFQRMVDITSMSDHSFMDITAGILMDNESQKDRILRAVCNADICVENITVEKEPLDMNELPLSVRKDFESKDIGQLHKYLISSVHKKYDNNKNEVGHEIFDFEQEESKGSQKFFALIGPILDSLRFGLVLIVDEIDARLHPKLCEMLISLFTSKKLNKNNAQLIFATHNTLIMNKSLLRRDQIYFVDKNKFGESELYSLLDYKKVRNDASYDKDYLMGKYGGLPSLANFESILSGNE